MAIVNPEEIGSAVGEVGGGFSHTEFYIGFLEQFETLTEPADRETAANLADLVTITAPHTFKTGFGFIKVRCIQETVGLETAQIGSATLSPMQENKLTLQVLGSEAELLGFKRLIKGRDLIALAPQADNGNVRQIGSAKFAGRAIETSSKIEAASEGENTTTIVIQDKQKYDAPIYEGTITTQPAV